MGNIGYMVASENGVPIAADTVISIGGVPITNSVLMGIIISLLLIGGFLFMAVRLHARPTSRFAFFMETIVEFVINGIRSTLGGNERTIRRFLPLYCGFFVFILCNNLFGLLPGMGGAVYVSDGGITAALLRPVTTDLNGTLALAIVAILTVHIFAIQERGVFGHIAHYFSVMKPWWNPVNFFIGSIEILGEFIRLLTLSLRLFGVIYAGEVLLHVIVGLSGVFAPIATLPIILLEIFFSFIQAYLFVMLSSTYLSIGTAHDEGANNEQSSPTVHTSSTRQSVKASA